MSSFPAPAAVAGTAAFGKFMHVLQLVADWPEGGEPAGVTALVRASGYPRPTVHRIVAALLAEGMLQETPSAGLAPGPRLMQLAARSWGRSELRLAAVDELKRLRDRTGETVHLAVPSAATGTMVYIEKLESPSAVRMASRIGASVCMHATAVGKAYLAALQPAQREPLLAQLQLTRFMPNTLTDLTALRAELERTQARGWSIDNEENEAGICCYGAAIRGDQGQPVAALSVSTLLFRQTGEPHATYVQPLLEAAQAISARVAQWPALARAEAL